MYVFMPPLGHLEDYLALVGTVESVAKKLNIPVCLEGVYASSGSTCAIDEYHSGPGRD